MEAPLAVACCCFFGILRIISSGLYDTKYSFIDLLLFLLVLCAIVYMAQHAGSGPNCRCAYLRSVLLLFCFFHGGLILVTIQGRVPFRRRHIDYSAFSVLEPFTDLF